MKFLSIAVLIVAGSFFSINNAEAKKIKCRDFEKVASQQSQSLLEKEKQLGHLEKEIQGATKAAEEFTKACQTTSNPNCNPNMYRMITSRLPSMTDQRQQLQGKIMESESKRKAALKDLNSCKSVIRNQTL